MYLRARQRKVLPNWRQRFGQFDLPPANGKHRIWVHAVSVGEVMAAQPVLRELRNLLPSDEIVVSVTTSSGHETAQKQLNGLYDHLVYFPIDTARWQLSAMQQVRPRVVAIMETELWFNFLWAADAFRAETILINGRISDRSFARMKSFLPFYRSMLSLLGVAAMQSEADADRIRALGARTVEVIGNTKYDQALSDTPDADHWRRELGITEGDSVVVFGSVRAEEFALLAPSIDEFAASALVVVVPRHIERTPDLVAALKSETVLRSEGGRARRGHVLVVDTYGELNGVYSCATVAVVGGGFADLGGQNILQPMALGVPTVHGPHMQNFRAIAADAEAAQATVECSANELPRVIRDLLTDSSTRQTLVRHARTLLESHRGAARRYAQRIQKLAEKSQAKPGK